MLYAQSEAHKHLALAWVWFNKTKIVIALKLSEYYSTDKKSICDMEGRCFLKRTTWNPRHETNFLSPKMRQNSPTAM